MISGCEQCHAIGKPNDDGTVGTCTACHSRHTSPPLLWRACPPHAAQCHMGPDHSQIEIYEESKHGIMFAAQERLLNSSSAQVPHHARHVRSDLCHVPHDRHQRAEGHARSLGAPLVLPRQRHHGKRPNYVRPGEHEAGCTQCHTRATVDRVYYAGGKGGRSLPTQRSSTRRTSSTPGVRKDSLYRKAVLQPHRFRLLRPVALRRPTSKHGAFMGGADFVQWHGNYPIMQKTIQLEHDAAELRREHGHK